MTLPPPIEAFDHVHVFVADRLQAERWYARVLGLHRATALEAWATDGGPLTLTNANGEVHVALFERPAQPCRSTVALRVTGAQFRAWHDHLTHELAGAVSVEDHQLSLSLYFRDPDGNPYEITTYEVDAVRGERA